MGGCQQLGEVAGAPGPALADEGFTAGVDQVGPVLQCRQGGCQGAGLDCQQRAVFPHPASHIPNGQGVDLKIPPGNLVLAHGAAE